MNIIILTGGRSSRLGRDKASEPLGDETLLHHVMRSLAGIGSEFILVAGQTTDNIQVPPGIAVRIVRDVYPGCGPLAGIHAGLVNATSFHSLAVACDMPFLNPGLIRYQMRLAQDFDMVIPVEEGYLEPLHAIYSKKCIPPIENMLQTGRNGIYALASLVKTRTVDKAEIEKFDPKHLSFFNLNNETDLEFAKQLMAE